MRLCPLSGDMAGTSQKTESSESVEKNILSAKFIGKYPVNFALRLKHCHVQQESSPASLSMVALSMAGEPSEISAIGVLSFQIFHQRNDDFECYQATHLPWDFSLNSLYAIELCFFSGIWKVDLKVYPQKVEVFQWRWWKDMKNWCNYVTCILFQDDSIVAKAAGTGYWMHHWNARETYSTFETQKQTQRTITKNQSSINVDSVDEIKTSWSCLTKRRPWRPVEMWNDFKQNVWAPFLLSGASTRGTRDTHTSPNCPYQQFLAVTRTESWSRQSFRSKSGSRNDFIVCQGLPFQEYPGILGGVS